MDLQGLKDQFGENIDKVKNLAQESPLYNTLKEKFEALPSRSQKITIFGAIALVIFLVLSIPFSYISVSKTNIEAFEQDRSLIKRLLKTKQAQNLPKMPNIETTRLKTQIEALLKRSNLLDEQIDDIKDVPSPSPFITNKVKQSGLDVFLKNLNLQQIKDIGFELQKINPNAKLTGLNINASKDKENYFYVVFSLKNISFPEVSLSPNENEKPSRSKKRGRRDR